ncbi:hypothetical protein HYC85_001944 [Camellia sinensis]|uniref:EamA domain-containing protein n=1 Tax=Camellia sinensis TaxID=4442 RepID=A0A7J7I7D7_CAMSI|nr:hypothetical protein HYC85_001944 [Camellia sinensis]
MKIVQTEFLINIHAPTPAVVKAQQIPAAPLTQGSQLPPVNLGNLTSSSSKPKSSKSKLKSKSAKSITDQPKSKEKFKSKVKPKSKSSKDELFSNGSALSSKLNHVKFKLNCVTERATDSDTQLESPPPSASPPPPPPSAAVLVGQLWEWAVLVSPFFFWGTAMVAMKEVLPKTGPFFVSSFRLIPAGLLLVAFASSRGRPLPSGLTAWLSISLFALVDATCFQGFLAEGLERTSAGLGSVIIDSQPLTVAVLAALLFGESIGFVGAAGLVLGVIGLLLLEVPAISFDGSNFSLWGSGEWWMLLAAQSMAVGTVMVRWVTKYSDPIMATGWHMVIGGLPLVVISILNHDPALNGSLMELTSKDATSQFISFIFRSPVVKGAGFRNTTQSQDLCINSSIFTFSSSGFFVKLFKVLFGKLYGWSTLERLQFVMYSITLASSTLVVFAEINVGLLF